MSLPLLMAGLLALTAISALKGHLEMAPTFARLSTVLILRQYISIASFAPPWGTESNDELTIGQTTRASCREEL